MPNIRDYTFGGNINIQPTEVGIEATAGAAPRIGAFYNQTAGALDRTGARAGSALAAAGDVYVKAEDHQQISAGAKQFAVLMDNATTTWNNLVKNADPNDPSVKEKFRQETLEPALQQFQSAFTTERAQAWAESHVDSFREHMFHKTSADMATLAGRAVHSNLETMGTTLGNTVYNDPSALDQVLKTGHASIAGMADSSPNLDAGQSAAVKGELGPKLEKHVVNQAILGAIRNGGDWQAIANKYPQYVDRAAVDQHVRTEERARRADQAYSDHINKVQIQDLSDKTKGEYLKLLHSDDPAERASVTAHNIANDQRLTEADREHFINIVERESKPATAARVSAQNTMQLFNDLRAGNLTSQGQIDEAYGSGAISRTDYSWLRTEFQERKSAGGEQLSRERQEFFKSMERIIDPSRSSDQRDYRPSALGVQKMYEFQRAARRQEDMIRAKGDDPHLAYDPTSEYYVGSPEWLDKHRATLTDVMNYDKQITSGAPLTPLTAPPPPPPSPPDEPRIPTKERLRRRQQRIREEERIPKLKTENPNDVLYPNRRGPDA